MFLLSSFVYGYNQGVFSGILTMTAFGDRMSTNSLPRHSVVSSEFPPPSNTHSSQIWANG